ncbi:Ferredoxin--NADP reductase [compost metagenome]
MALGRAMKKVLVVDSGKPCNRQTPHSHNFLTNDGRTPAEISTIAKFQVKNYKTVSFFEGKVIAAYRDKNGFIVKIESGEVYNTKKMVFATGIKDILPPIQGIDACWGISVIHCPYCHGYEVREEKTGIIGNGDLAFDFVRLISNWTNALTLFTNGPSTVDGAKSGILKNKGILIIEKKIRAIEHREGHIEYLLFEDGSRIFMKALYAPSPFEQHCNIPQQIGCELTTEGYVKVDGAHETTVPGIYAIGDCSSKMRTVAGAVSSGTSCGIQLSKKMILEEF